MLNVALLWCFVAQICVSRRAYVMSIHFFWEIDKELWHSLKNEMSTPAGRIWMGERLNNLPIMSIHKSRYILSMYLIYVTIVVQQYMINKLHPLQISAYISEHLHFPVI